jgi:hypothetical protein
MQNVAKLICCAASIISFLDGLSAGFQTVCLLPACHTAVRHLLNKKREGRIKKLEMNSKNKNIRDLYMRIEEFMRSYQP